MDTFWTNATALLVHIRRVSGSTLQAGRNALFPNPVLQSVLDLVDIVNDPDDKTRLSRFVDWLHKLPAYLKDLVASLSKPLALWTYNVVGSNPLVQLVTMGTQWGPDMKTPYPLFAVEEYWVKRFKEPGGLPVLHISFLLISFLLSHIDLLARLVLSFIYGACWMVSCTDLQRMSGSNVECKEKQLASESGVDKNVQMPILWSLVSYLDIPDNTPGPGQPRQRQSQVPFQVSESLKDGLAAIADAEAAPATNDPLVLQAMVEACWLAYEEPPVVQAVLKGWGVEPGSIKVLDFYSITYKTLKDYAPHGKDLERERPLDMQCFMFKMGDAVVVAFRGSQFLNWFDWLYNFTVNSLQQKTKAGSNQSPQAHEAARTSGYRKSSLDKEADNSATFRMHEGFAGNLGLSVFTDKHPYTLVAEATSCEYIQWPPERSAGGAPLQGTSDSDGSKMDIDSWKRRPYDVIRHHAQKLLDEVKGNKSFYITGHSLGGADAAVFASTFEYEPKMPLGICTHLVTFGQPCVGDERFASFMEDRFGKRYVRVVNHNDLVARVPTFFLDTGAAFVHPDKCSQAYIDADGMLRLESKDKGKQQDALPEEPVIKPFDRLIYTSWLKLKVAWSRLGTPPQSGGSATTQLQLSSGQPRSSSGTSTPPQTTPRETSPPSSSGTSTPPQPTPRETSLPSSSSAASKLLPSSDDTPPQSSLRFLARAALLPIMMINDHLDYKFLLNHQPPQTTGRGYWQANP